MNEQEQWKAFQPSRIDEPIVQNNFLPPSGKEDCINEVQRLFKVKMVDASPKLCLLLEVEKMLVEEGSEGRFEALKDSDDPRGSLPRGVWMALLKKDHEDDSWLADPKQ